MALLKYFCLMSVVLFIGLAGWSVWQIRKWPVDYSQFKAEALILPPYDTSYKQRINPKYFVNVTVIKDEENLRNPEDIAVANDGTIYTALKDGTIAAVNSTGGVEALTRVNNSGLMLGILLTSDEKTIYTVSEHQGLIKFDIKSRQYVSLFNKVEGQQVVALNELCHDQANNILYITESGPISMVYSSKQTLLKHKKGRILAYDLNSNQLKVIKREIGFPNGIVYEASKQAVIYSELTQHRLVRLYVDGPKKDQTEIVLENFFGYIDNMQWDENGHILAGVPALRDEISDFADRQPQIRQFMTYLPELFLYSLISKVAGAVRIDVESGKVIEEMFGAPVKTYFIPTVVEKNGKRYFSSLKTPTILVMDINKDSKESQSGPKQEEL